MSINLKNQAAILVEETHYFRVELSDLSSTTWQEAKGLIEVNIPYDGCVFDKDMSRREMLDLGKIEIKRSDDKDAHSETWPIKIVAGKNWHHNLKSAKRAVCRAEYEIAQPQETIVDVQGEILDIPKQDSTKTNFDNHEAFQNSLQLNLKFWLPDLYHTILQDKSAEIQGLLLQREHTQQIFIHTPILSIESNLTEKLAKSLVALANTYGGTILVGVDEKGNVHGLSATEIRKIPTQLLRALLQTSPIVPLKRVESHHTPQGTIYLIEVGSTGFDVIYATKGEVYRREKKKTERIKVKTLPTPPSMSIPAPKSLIELLGPQNTEKELFTNNSKVAALELSDDLAELNLGQYISGMINAGFDTATIVIRTSQQNDDASNNFSKKQIKSYIDSELEQITPSVSQYDTTLTNTEKYKFAIITVPIRHIIMAIYGKKDKDSDYIWMGKDGLRSIPVAALLSNYVSGKVSRGQRKDMINMEVAHVEWPIRPPEKVSDFLLKATNGDTVDFNVQYQVLVWKDSIKTKKDLTGYQISLALPLNNAALTLDDTGQLVRHSPVVNGQFNICLEDVLVSGTEVSVARDNKTTQGTTGYLQNLPIIKRTQLQLDLAIHLSELFKHRPRGSCFGFTLSQVTLDIDRAQDVIKACADMGFRLFTAPKNRSRLEVIPSEIQTFGEEPYIENSHWLIPNGYVEGIRSQNFFDISLILGWVSTRSEIVRELHYEDVYDKSTSKAHTVNFHIYLWSRDKAQQEIGQIQMGLYELIQRRLHQIDTD